MSPSPGRVTRSPARALRSGTSPREHAVCWRLLQPQACVPADGRAQHPAYPQHPAPSYNEVPTFSCFPRTIISDALLGPVAATAALATWRGAGSAFASVRGRCSWHGGEAAHGTLWTTGPSMLCSRRSSVVTVTALCWGHLVLNLHIYWTCSYHPLVSYVWSLLLLW